MRGINPLHLWTPLFFLGWLLSSLVLYQVGIEAPLVAVIYLCGQVATMAAGAIWPRGAVIYLGFHGFMLLGLAGVLLFVGVSVGLVLLLYFSMHVVWLIGTLAVWSALDKGE